jgi:hypothetical protein
MLVDRLHSPGRHLARRLRAALALGGGLALAALPSPPAARAEVPVAATEAGVVVNIRVFEGHRTRAGFDPRITDAKVRAQIQELGFAGARFVDELDAARAEPGTGVSLEFRPEPTEPARTLAVKVLEVKPEEVRLEISIPDFKFSAKTTHKKGGTFLLVHKRDAERTLFLAVRPRQ